MGRPPKVVIPVDVLRALYVDEELSTSEIGKRFGLTGGSVGARLEQAGIPRRPARPGFGSKNPCWRGGRTVDKSGYVLVHCPDHPHANSNGYVREHRLVMEQKLGRHLLPDEVVHHLDSNRGNNHPDNLSLYAANSDHLREELLGRVPRHSPQGLARMRENGGRPECHPEWTDERRERARVQMKERWKNSPIPRRVWTDEEREKQRLRALRRKRNPDGTLA